METLVKLAQRFADLGGMSEVLNVDSDDALIVSVYHDMIDALEDQEDHEKACNVVESIVGYFDY